MASMQTPALWAVELLFSQSQAAHQECRPASSPEDVSPEEVPIPGRLYSCFYNTLKQDNRASPYDTKAGAYRMRLCKN